MGITRSIGTLRVEKDFYTAQDGTPLYYELIQSPQQAVPMLALHGYTVRGDMFYPLCQPLAKERALVLPDLRGHARSSNVQHSPSVQQWADDLRDLLDFLGLDRVALFGYSMGGVVAQQFAIAYPERVHRLILGVTWAYKPQTFLEGIQQFMLPTVFASMGAGTIAQHLTDEWIGHSGIASESVAGWYREVLASTPDTHLVEAAREIYAFDSRRLLPRIQVPTLVIGGTRDLIVPAYHSRMLANLIPGAQLALIEGAGHGLMFTHTAQLADILQGFLNPQSPR